MSKVFAFLADGLEEVECLAVVDVLRRAGAEVTLVSVTGSREITGSHHIHFQADALFDETAADDHKANRTSESKWYSGGIWGEYLL